ncbi:MAG: hypothetical protein WA691_06145 [Thermoplasmata archaeon]
MDGSRDTHAAGLGCRLDSGRDIHRVSEDVALALFDVPQMNPYPKLDRPYIRLGVPLMPMLLDVDRALDSMEGAVEFREKPVAHRFYFASVMGREEGTNQSGLLVT